MRSCRNFWVETVVDGCDTRDAAGPRSKDGGFVTTVYVRENGGSAKKVTIEGFVTQADLLQLHVNVEGHDSIVLEVTP